MEALKGILVLVWVVVSHVWAWFIVDPDGFLSFCGWALLAEVFFWAGGLLLMLVKSE